MSIHLLVSPLEQEKNAELTDGALNVLDWERVQQLQRM